MPAYNSEKFIESAVSSVLAQTFTDFELLIVDNGSMDNTPALVSSFRDSRIRCFRIGNNGTVSMPRNFAISESRGQYLAFLDADDVWLPYKLAEQVDILGEQKDLAMVYARYQTLSGDSVSSAVFPPEDRCPSGSIFRQLYVRPFIACSGVLLRKSLLEEVGGFNQDRSLIAAEDTDLWLRLSLRREIACSSSHPLFLYRVHLDSISGSSFARYKRALVLTFKYRREAGGLLFIKSFFLATGSFFRQAIAHLINFNSPAGFG